MTEKDQKKKIFQIIEKNNNAYKVECYENFITAITALNFCTLLEIYDECLHSEIKIKENEFIKKLRK